jgi:uncharacterized protein YggU (UPF0235/DUF167 family)
LKSTLIYNNDSSTPDQPRRTTGYKVTDSPTRNEVVVLIAETVRDLAQANEQVIVYIYEQNRDVDSGAWIAKGEWSRGKKLNITFDNDIIIRKALMELE